MEFTILINSKNVGNIDNKIIKPKRFDIYAHICKINNMKSKTQIYNSYNFINENTLIIFK